MPIIRPTGEGMKNILAIGFMSLAFSAGASSQTPLVTCHSQEENLILCIYDLSSAPNWSSVMITWSHAATCAGDPMQITYTRQFVQNEVRYFEADGIEGYQNDRFLGFGRKTQFSLNRQAGTAIVSGKNGGTFSIQDGPSAPSEKKGKYSMEFSDCH
jgi:hypothetical protein